MPYRNDIHHLVRATWKARTIAYSIAAVILAAHVVDTGFTRGYVLFLLFLLVYPHLVLCACSRSGDQVTAARWIMPADFALVGVMIVAAGFSTLPTVAFVNGIVMSTLTIARPEVLLAGVLSLLASVAAVVAVVDPVAGSGGTGLTDLLSAIFIVVYGGLVGRLAFAETTGLVETRRNLHRQKDTIEGVYRRIRPYVSPQLVTSLHSRETVATRRKFITVFFSDIQGFTALMDRQNEEMVARMLNGYLDEMARIADSHGGTIDKFMGDGVMVLFGAPGSRGIVADAVSCVAMALEMRDALDAIRHHWQLQGIPDGLHIRIGIHSGYCAVGNMGSSRRMDYTAVGGVVNIASRLENAAGRDEILVSLSAWSLVCGSFRGIRKADIAVKGIRHRVPVVSIDSRRTQTESANRFRLLSAGAQPRV